MEAKRRVALTTIDNPYNPFTEFSDWYRFDTMKGYNTSEYLARIAVTSDGVGDVLNDMAIEEAIDEIVKLNALGIYKKVTSTDAQM